MQPPRKAGLLPRRGAFVNYALPRGDVDGLLRAAVGLARFFRRAGLDGDHGFLYRGTRRAANRAVAVAPLLGLPMALLRVSLRSQAFLQLNGDNNKSARQSQPRIYT